MADAGHRREELLQARRIGVERLEEARAAGLDLVLRLPGAQRLGEVPPERIEAVVRHLEDAADVRRLLAVEEEIGLGRVARSDRRSRCEEAERHQRVEEVARRARVQAEAAARAPRSASGPRASSVKTPISMALSSVFEAQNARPVCRIFSGFGGCMDGVRARVALAGKARSTSASRCREVKPGCVAHLLEFATRPMKDGNRPCH